MNLNSEHFILNSSQYTPIYFVTTQDISQLDLNRTAPASNNLKTFYEKSGNIENLESNDGESQPIIKKKNHIGNNLKLASFLVPRNENSKTPIVNTNPKPIPTSNNNDVGKVNVSSIVDLPTTIIQKAHSEPGSAVKLQIGNIIPKVKPLESPVPVNFSSVQLLKLGETYHSLNKLSDDQMKTVSQALNNIKESDKIPTEPTYDPVTNTRFIYRVISPSDLKVVGKNKLVIKDKNGHTSKDTNRISITPEKSEILQPVQTQTTRSGRRVKLPSHILTDSTHRPRKKIGNIVSCSQCSTEFDSIYSLQNHYEINPTHVSAKIHSNLFQCLMSILKSGPVEDRTKIFIDQLEELIDKLKSLLPCLLKKIDGKEGKLCTISDHVGRLFGMNPGNYNLNVDALNCVKDNEGYCKHNPPKINKNHEVNLPQYLLSKSPRNEEAAKENNKGDWIATSIEQPPIANKRINKIKPKIINAKKIKLSPEDRNKNVDQRNDPIFCNQIESPAIIPQSNLIFEENTTHNKINELAKDISNSHLVNETVKPAHVQFRSKHFDIRSSPIKSTTTIFNKFQINSENINSFDVPMITLENNMEKINEITNQTNENSLDLETMLQTDDKLCKDMAVVHPDILNVDNNKSWMLETASNDCQNNCELKSNNYIESSLIYKDTIDMATNFIEPSLIQDVPISTSVSDEHLVNNQSLNQGQEFNFLDSLNNDCLSYPEPKIRTNPVDFNLDLFSFNNS